MLSQTAEYALRAMTLMATNPGVFLSTQTISEGTKVPLPYLSKILQELDDHSLVINRRGSKGGFKLARPAEQINLLEIIRIFDPIKRIKGCPLGLERHRNQLCPMHKRLDDAAAHVEKVYSSSLLSEMVEASNFLA